MSERANNILEDFATIKDLIQVLNDKSAESLEAKVDVILEDFATVKLILSKVDENIDGDMTRQLSIIESNFESLVSQIAILFDKSDLSLADKINKEFDAVTDKIEDIVASKLEDYKLKIEKTFDNIEVNTIEQSKYLHERISDLNSAMKTVWREQTEENLKQIDAISDTLKDVIEENIKLTSVDYAALKSRINEFAQNIESSNEGLTQDLKAQLDDITKYIDSVLELQAQEVVVKHDELSALINSSTDKLEKNTETLSNLLEEQLEISRNSLTQMETVNQLGVNNNLLIEDLKESVFKQCEIIQNKDDLVLDTANSIKGGVSSVVDLVSDVQTDIVSVSQSLENNKSLLKDLDTSIIEKFSALQTFTADISAGELQTMDSYIERLSEQLESQKKQIQSCKDLIIEYTQNELNSISNNIEKETDAIISELVEQFDLVKSSQNDEFVKLTASIEDIINAHIYNNIEDLKSYLDIKTDNSVCLSKLDNLKIEMTNAVEDIIKNLNKMLDSSVFTSAMGDFRVANELLINSVVDRLNEKIDLFISENGKTFEEKLSLFDKKFIDTVVDKFEEVKLLSNQYNSSFNTIEATINNVFDEFVVVKSSVNSKIDALADMMKESVATTNKEVRALNESFENLRSQISNKSFDEAFQASINKQIGGLESLITEQLGYIQDINDLCVNNLPEVTELNTLVKHSILESINDFSSKIDECNVEEQLNQLKSEIVTQILNVFNQVSFVAEQEEILDYIQDKHDELITILSHIVTTTADIAIVKDNVSVVDNKINSLKDDIELLNEKITAIISSEGDIDYVYSLQDLESDIANLRLVLNDMKRNDHGQEFEDLISSTNEIYSLVESVKAELPSKADFEALSEDIVSISSRTNKLILASDESYKTLQDNLQDFKLVINDLDERTRNFAQDTGIDRIDNKLNAINSMMVNGAKTNQVFNQIFEYLAEWVDNASVQINSISDSVETLDEIGQIKLMLADMKANSEDNTEAVELVETLGVVFDKQAKRISSLETKLDKIIVETTISNKNSKIDMTPFEETLNKFLVAMDEKLASQQLKIDSLESKLEGMSSLLDNKDTATLSKKVGGMDRQIAKLNKSIEKIASHVVEK